MALLFLIVLFVESIVICAQIADGSQFDNLAAQRYEIWAQLAAGYVRNISCDLAFFAVPDQCKQMKLTSSERMNVYSAEAGKRRKLIAVLPDGTLSRSGAHDGIVVIDPFPVASFGHLVVAFFVDRLDRASCEFYGGIYIENHNDCLRLALKNGCHNLLARQQRYQNYVQRHAMQKIHKCEIDFLPLVYEIAGNNPILPRNAPINGQKLQCRELDGFARCPMSTSNGPSRVTRNSFRSSSENDETANIRCRLFEICDHAVLVHGGWGHVTTRKSDLGLLLATRRMLAKNGFGNIMAFYKNGVPDEDEDYGDREHSENGTAQSIYPAADKRRLRSYVQMACSSLHCVDTLAVFLKGPALHDGALLLYDNNQDGIAGQDEMYTVGEMISDLTNCMARRVFVVADYSYSGRLTASIEHEQRRVGNNAYGNIIVVTSGDEEQYSWDNQFTESWNNANHRSNCFRNIHQINKDLVSRSSPTIFDGSRNDDDLSTTLCGAPCNLYPPLTDAELRNKYQGCNNVPSWLWFQTKASNATASPGLPSAGNQTRLLRI